MMDLDLHGLSQSKLYLNQNIKIITIAVIVINITVKDIYAKLDLFVNPFLKSVIIFRFYYLLIFFNLWLKF